MRTSLLPSPFRSHRCASDCSASRKQVNHRCSASTGAQAARRRAAGDAVHLGVAKVPDPRLDTLSAMHKPKKTTPATVEYMDLAAIEKGEAAEGLPLEQLRTVDALAHVVRAFRDESISARRGDDRRRARRGHDGDRADPGRSHDRRARMRKLELAVKKTNKDEGQEGPGDAVEVSRRRSKRKCRSRNVELSEDELKRLSGLHLPVVEAAAVVVNADESDASKLDGGAAAFGLATFAGRPNYRGRRALRQDRGRDRAARSRRRRRVSRRAGHPTLPRSTG